jgi:hypothetical protein
MSSMPDEARPPRKDRLIQTRVPRQLETTLKEEARRRRLTVSHLIRNVLEESFQLVDGFVADVDQIVSDSANLARNMSRGARRVVGAGRIAGPQEAPPGDDLSHVYAWNEVVLHQQSRCSSCSADLARGATGYAGLSDAPGRPRAWLCPECIENL